MTAGEYCNREVVITEKDISVVEAAKLMRQHHVGDLVVIEKQEQQVKPVGIITDRDIVIKTTANNIDPGAIAVHDVMSKDLVTVKEKETLLDTLNLMKTQGIRRILVVDDRGNLQGLLSADDAIELMAEAMNDLTQLVRREISREEKE